MNFRRYYQYLKLEKGFSPNTVEAYMRDVERFAEYAEAEGFDLLNPKLEHFHHFSAMIMDLGCTVTTLARMLAAIHNFYTFLVLSDVIESDPMELLEYPRKPLHLPDVLTVEEIDMIESCIDLSAPEGHRNRAIIETLFSCGLRVSELCNLRLQDLYLDEEFIRVNGKGSKQRLVPISGRAIHELQLWFDDRNHMEIPAKYADYVFISKRRKNMSRITVFHFIKQLVEAAGIKKTVSPHTFRHSFATALLEGGANLRAIQTMLGHENIGTTEIYLHTDTRHLRQELLEHHPRYAGEGK